MKKSYMPMLALVSILSMWTNSQVNGQTMPEFEPFTYTHIYTWNTAPYQSFQYAIPSGPLTRFRLMTPNGFDRFANDGKLYPIIIFLHGSGEAGAYDATPNNGVGEQDNEKQLVHGGQTHMTAVQNGTFPGLLLYPQIRRPNPALGIGPSWGFDNLKAVEYILRKLIEGYKVDPDRIYIHGLSMGGEGAWRFISWRPDLFAAAHPMSAAGTAFWKNKSSPPGYWDGEARQRYKHIPLRLSQGALDTGPLPLEGDGQVDAIRDIGGNIRYSYYPTLGHGTWNSEYAKPDFFSWLLSQRKNNIHVYYGQTSFCPGEAFSVTLGLTPGFAQYEWAKNGVTFLTSATANEVTITQAVSASSGVGTYTARFQRANGVWTAWSDPVNINSNRGLSPTPTISANGQSRNLPALDGSPDITLTGTDGKAAYVWKRDATTLANNTQNVNVNVAGSYTLKTRDFGETGREADGITPTEFRAAPLGCLSADSNPISITTSNGFGVPSPPANVVAGANSQTSISLSWDDRSNNETGFELYRSSTAGIGYKLISILSASSSPNPQSYVDNNLQANTTYYYRLRAINAAGGSAYTPEVSTTTVADNAAPTAPVLTVQSTSRTEINLAWSGATDNVGVAQYDIYQNDVLITSTKDAFYKVTGVTAFTTYTYVVKARDGLNNVSPPSNQVTTAAINNGLSYKYYEHNNLSNCAQITVSGTLIKTGSVAAINFSPKNRDDQFAFIIEGFINIPTTGTYTFFISSDDGSQLYLNNNLIANNDGTHGCTEKSSAAISLAAGSYPIKALMFENTGGECLTARWQGPGIAKAEIPASAFIDTYTPPAALTAPTSVAANALAYNQINLTWNDNSANETGFEIQRSLVSGSGYQTVKVTTANAISWSDNTVNPSTQYFYKIRAISSNSGSSVVGPVNATTPGAPAAPAAPSGLAAVADTPTQVTLSWTDNSSTETGYEIQKSSQAGTGFITLATVAAGSTGYVDTKANGHSSINYRVRAIGAGGVASAYSNEANTVTGNRPPVIANIVDRCIAIGSTFSIDVDASDPDLDPLSFTFPNGLPPFATFQSNGFGKGKITFTNALEGTYTLRVQPSDGTATTFDDFVLTVNTNNSPVLADIPFQTSEEGRLLYVTASATDLDATDVLTYTVSGLPSFATWSASQKRITFRPVAGSAGTYENITVTVKDNKVPAGIDTKSFTLVVSPLDQFYSISVNFATTPSMYESAPWNNTGLPQVADLTNLKDDQGNIVRFVALNTGTSWTTTAPQVIDLPFSSTAVYTEKVRESYYRKSAGGAGNKMKIKGLNPAMQYKVTLYGAGGWIGGTAPAGLTTLNTLYTVVGLTTQSLQLNTLNNSSNTVTTDLMKPSSAGEIAITVGRGTDNINHFYINAMILQAFFDNGSAPAAPSNLVATANAYNSVKLSWKDNSINETRFDILRSATLNGVYSVIGSTAANATEFTDGTTVGRTSYYYIVRAANNTGSGDSAPQLVTTPNGIPVITSFQTVVVNAGQTFQRTITATDPDGDPIVLSTLNLPSFATLVDNGNGTGYIQFAPQTANIGSYAFTLSASDNFNGRADFKSQMIAADPAYSEVVYIDFNATGATPSASPWNNVTAFNNAAALTNLAGTASPITLKVGTGWTGSSNTVGVSTGTDAGIYPDNVVSSAWSTSSTSTGATVVLKGLDVNKRYNFTLVGSTNEFWFANSIYVVSGASSATKTLNTSKNKDRFVKFPGVQPQGDSVVITVKKGPNMNSSPVVAQRDGVMSALVIETATPGANPIRPTNFTADASGKTSARLSWTDNASDETGYEVYRATSQAGPFTLIATTASNVETYSNTGLTPNTAYVYHIRAVKAGGASAYSSDAFVRTYNQIIYVNVNSSAAAGQLQASAPWNNLATPPSDGLSFSNFNDDTNAPTTVGLDLLSWENGGTNNTGFLTGNNSGIYPDAVLENYYYFEQFDPETEYQLKGLNSNFVYDLVFLGDEWNVATTGLMIVATDFTAAGTTVSQFNGKNTTETVAIKQIVPEGTTIPFEIKADDEARYGVWNSLEIHGYSPIGSAFDIVAPSAPASLIASNITNTAAQLTWSAATDNVAVTGYRIYQGNGTLVTTIAGTTAPLSGLTAATTYVYYVKAIDAAGNESASSKAVKFTTTNGGGGRVAQHVAEEPALVEADLYPNPVTDKVRIKISAVDANEPVALIIYNVQGKTIAEHQKNYQPEGVEISTANFNNGLYIMRIQVKGRQLVKRFAKE